MRPVSQRFLDAVVGSHTMAVRAQLVPRGQTGVAPTGGVAVSVIGGDVTMDAGADIRSSAQVDISPEYPWPTADADPLAPFGAYELFIERGVSYGGGGTEYVSLGYFRMNDIEQDNAPLGPIRITATDRMAAVIDAKVTSPKQYAKTQTYGQVLSAIVTYAIPDVVIEWDDTDVRDDAIGRSIIVEEDHYATAYDLVTSVGKVMYFDYRGILLVRDAPVAENPVWAVARGAGGVLVSAGRRISREGVYNGVIVTGEGIDTETPVRATVVDSDPSSRTYWYGDFGKVPREYASPLVTTTAQATLAGKSLLRKTLGLPYSVNFSAVPNPALEAGDPIVIAHGEADNLLRRGDTHIINTLTVPLSVDGALAGTTREQSRVTLDLETP